MAFRAYRSAVACSNAIKKKRRQRELLLERDGNRCRACGRAAINIQPRMLVTRRQGGQAVLENLWLACPSCNHGWAGRRPLVYNLNRLERLGGVKPDRRWFAARLAILARSHQEWAASYCAQAYKELTGLGLPQTPSPRLVERMLFLERRDGRGCVWCRRELDLASGDATVDHLIPRSKEGPNRLENLAVACRSCNHARANRSARAWAIRCELVGLPVNKTAIERALTTLEQMGFSSAENSAGPLAAAA